MTAQEFAALYKSCDFERKRILSGLMHVCMAQKLLTPQEVEKAYKFCSLEHRKILAETTELCKKQMELKEAKKNGIEQ